MAKAGTPILEEEQLRRALELDMLSRQQREIAILGLEGLSVRQIAGWLGLRPSNVSTQLRRVAQKIAGVSSGEINKKRPGAEPALLSDLRQIPPERHWQYSPQQQSIIKASHSSNSLKDISRFTSIPYNTVRTQVKRILQRLEKEAEMERTVTLRVAIR